MINEYDKELKEEYLIKYFYVYFLNNNSAYKKYVEVDSNKKKQFLPNDFYGKTKYEILSEKFNN